MSEIDVIHREKASSRSSHVAPISQADRHYVAILKIPWIDVALGIGARNELLTSIDFLPGNQSTFTACFDIAREAVAQLNAFFRNPRHQFTLPIDPTGTVFQRKVWNALRAIPVGETLSYGELAMRLRSSARAIGGACRVNPIPVIIPCHRIVAAQGIGGFMGFTAGRSVKIKQSLLAHESYSQ